MVGTNTASFAYDGRNRCVLRVINSATNLLYYSDWNLTDERDGSGAQIAEYIHGARMDEILMAAISTNAYYHHHDALGNVTHITDAASAVAEKYSYDIFGTPAIRDGSGNVLTNSAVRNRFLFTGREYLDNLQLSEYRNRFYSAMQGRFLQTDPMRLKTGDVNLYRYVSNDPISQVDPQGLDSPGCDGIPDFLETPCLLQCCADHDNCYDIHGCTSTSWCWTSPPLNECDICNNIVVACFATCLYNNEDDPNVPNYYCAVHDLWFDDPNSPHMNHSTN
jgi:RHS repeat-associated protein